MPLLAQEQDISGHRERSRRYDVGDLDDLAHARRWEAGMLQICSNDNVGNVRTRSYSPSSLTSHYEVCSWHNV